MIVGLETDHLHKNQRAHNDPGDGHGAREGPHDSQGLRDSGPLPRRRVAYYNYSTPEGIAALKQCRQYADDQAKILHAAALDGFIDDFRSLLEDEQFQPAAGDADAARWHQKYVDLLDNPRHLNAQEVLRVAAEAVLAATVKATTDGDDESDSED